jgi:hypothetical protein
MISTQLLIQKANALVTAGGLTEDQLTQLSAIENFLSRAEDYSVATLADLPDAENNKGRLVYVVAEEDYYFSRGFDWTTVFDSSFAILEKNIYSFGFGADGRAGDGTNITRSSPVTPVGGITNWSQVSVYSTHTLSLSEDGVLYAHGNNSHGQLGDNTVTNKSSPVTVVGGITGWSQISAGLRYSLGIAGGVAYAWGSNGTGQLGDNTAISKRSPVTVVGGITSWSQLSGGNYHCLGIANGIAYAWGSGGTGRLGDDTIINKSSPVTVVGGITNWSQVSAGGAHSLGIADGIAYAWGAASSGQIGDSAIISRSSPVTVVGGITGWSQIDAGDAFSIALATNGIAYAWGLNNSGCLGIGIGVGNRSSPVTVVGGITNWSQVSAGGSHSLGIAGGIAYGWGSASYGRISDYSFATSSPVTITGGITNWSQVSAGSSSSAGIAIIEKGFNVL